MICWPDGGYDNALSQGLKIDLGPAPNSATPEYPVGTLLLSTNFGTQIAPVQSGNMYWNACEMHHYLLVEYFTCFLLFLKK